MTPSNNTIRELRNYLQALLDSMEVVVTNRADPSVPMRGIIQSVEQFQNRRTKFLQELEALMPVEITPAVQHVLRERLHQIKEKGYTAEHDDEHVRSEIAGGASAYALAAADAICAKRDLDEPNFSEQFPPGPWPDQWKFKVSEPYEMLAKAAAMCIAEMDRLDRIKAREQDEADNKALKDWAQSTAGYAQNAAPASKSDNIPDDGSTPVL